MLFSVSMFPIATEQTLVERVLGRSVRHGTT